MNEKYLSPLIKNVYLSHYLLIDQNLNLKKNYLIINKL